MKIALTVTLQLCMFICYGQILESEINPDGIVFPRMNILDRDALTPVIGQCVFNTDTNKINCFDGIKWNRTSHISIPATEAVYDENLEIGSFATFYQVTQSDLRGIVLPLHLPDGATLKAITYFYTDSNINNQIRLIFSQSSMTTNSGSATVAFGIDGVYKSTTISLDNLVVDNSINSYNISISPIQIPLDNTIKFHGASIEYLEN